MISNLLIIAGTGTKSGKTTLACRIIEQYSSIGIIAVKITPHFHEPTEGLITIEQGKGYGIFSESNNSTDKDTSRMLRAGAAIVYLATVWDSQLTEVFNRIMKEIPRGAPVVCESPALRNFIDPGLFIIMTSKSENKRQDLKHLRDLPHLIFKLEELKDIDPLPLGFQNKKWFVPELF